MDKLRNQLAYFKYDFPAGIVVFLVALPLCMGISLASGAPIYSGLITGIIAGIVVSLLSGSTLGISGPAAGLTLIVLGAIEKLGSFEIFLLATVIAGVFQIIFGFSRAGIISHYFPSSVIKGMLASIGLIVILKQIPHALGYDRDFEGEMEFFQSDGKNTFSEIFEAIRYISPGAIIIFIVCVLTLFFFESRRLKKYKFFQLLPGPLIAVFLGICINQLFRFFETDLHLVGNHLVFLPMAQNLEQWFQSSHFPDFSQILNPEVYVIAFTLAVIASLESLLSIEATDKLDPKKRVTPSNRELKAQGAGNILAGLLGGIPMTAVVIRSSANIQAGAKTKFASFYHGLFLLLTLIFIPNILNMIPLSALAAILIIAGFRLCRPRVFKDVYKLGTNQFIPFIVTVIAVLFTDLLIGIVIGLAVGVFFVLKTNYRRSYNYRKHFVGGGEKFEIDLSEHVSFINKASLLNKLNNLPENSHVKVNVSNVAYMDHDVAEALENFRQTARTKNIKFSIEKNQEEITSKVENIVKGLSIEKKDDHHHDDLAYRTIFENNRKWVAEKLQLDPNFFEDLARGQQPNFLFIGCSDSRVPANEITGTNPGEMFVHRNIANLVVHTDMNMLSVLQYAVEVLKVKHVIVCGHYGCGGVKAAMNNQQYGLIDSWLRNIKEVYRYHQLELEDIENEDFKFKRLVELNVIEQVYNLHKSTIIQNAWDNNAGLHVHGWVYDIREGLIRDLNVDVKKDFIEYKRIFEMVGKLK